MWLNYHTFNCRLKISLKLSKKHLKNETKIYKNKSKQKFIKKQLKQNLIKINELHDWKELRLDYEFKVVVVVVVIVVAVVVAVVTMIINLTRLSSFVFWLGCWIWTRI